MANDDLPAIGISLPIHMVPIVTRALKFFQQKCFVIEAHEHTQIDNLLVLLECYNDEAS